MKNEGTLALVERAIAGDRDAMTALFEQNAQRILYTATGMMGSRHDGEEAAQEILIRLYRNIGKLRSPEYFDTWVFRVIVNECSRLRKKRMPSNHDIPITEDTVNRIPEGRVEFLPSEFAEQSEKRQMLLDVVERLRPNYKTAILLYYFDGLTHAQAARAMGVTPKMVDQYLRRGRKKIREELQKAAGTKFDNIFAAAPVPVLTRVMQGHADALFPPGELGGHVARANKHAMERRGAGPQKPNALPTILACAAAAVAVLAVANAAAVARQSPISSSAAAEAGVPQPSAPAAAGGAMEIDETLSPMAGQKAPQSGPAETGEAGAQGDAAPGTVRGALVLKDAAGNVVDGGERYLAGITVELRDAGGNTAARAVAGADGTFEFSEKLANAGYAIKIETDGTELLPAAENPPAVDLRDGAGKAVVLYVYKTFDPAVEIRFTGGGCDCGHVNPKRAEAVCADALDSPKSWVITDEAGAEVARGETAAIGGAQLGALPEGKYTITWTVGDIAGNVGTARRFFRIVDGEVYPGMYQ